MKPDRTVATLVGALAIVGLVACGDDEAQSRQDDVANRGAEVMPFDLDATTHQFEPLANGLTETVVADDPTDSEQITLIQQHLTSEADRFQRGDFSDPATIHGDDMPGLDELQARVDAITIEFTPLTDGAQLTFSATDPELVDALHRWGEAQTMDHGTHAEHD